MSSEQQKTLAEVREAMNQMPNNPEQLASWLLDKFKLEKISDQPATPTEFHERKMVKPVKATAAVHDEVEVPPGGKKPLINKFFKNAGVQIKDAAYYKSLTEQQGNSTFDLSNLPDDEEFVPGGGVGEGSLESGLDDIPPALRASHEKLLNAREAISGGGGAFRRS